MATPVNCKYSAGGSLINYYFSFATSHHLLVFIEEETRLVYLYLLKISLLIGFVVIYVLALELLRFLVEVSFLRSKDRFAILKSKYYGQ